MQSRRSKITVRRALIIIFELLIISAAPGPDNGTCPLQIYLPNITTTFLFSDPVCNPSRLHSDPANGSHGVPENKSVALRKYSNVEAKWRLLFISCHLIVRRHHIGSRSAAGQMGVSFVSLFCLVSHYLSWLIDRYSTIVIISRVCTTFRFGLLTTLMPSRPPVHPYTSSSTSTGVHGHHNAAPHQLYKLFANLTFHIVPAKLEDDLARIYECIDELGGKCVGPEDAWVIVTALKGRQRLSRSLDQKWMVSSR